MVLQWRQKNQHGWHIIGRFVLCHKSFVWNKRTNENCAEWPWKTWNWVCRCTLNLVLSVKKWIFCRLDHFLETKFPKDNFPAFYQDFFKQSFFAVFRFAALKSIYDSIKKVDRTQLLGELVPIKNLFGHRNSKFVTEKSRTAFCWMFIKAMKCLHYDTILQPEIAKRTLPYPAIVQELTDTDCDGRANFVQTLSPLLQNNHSFNQQSCAKQFRRTFSVKPHLKEVVKSLNDDKEYFSGEKRSKLQAPRGCGFRTAFGLPWKNYGWCFTPHLIFLSSKCRIIRFSQKSLLFSWSWTLRLSMQSVQWDFLVDSSQKRKRIFKTSKDNCCSVDNDTEIIISGTRPSS